MLKSIKNNIGLNDLCLILFFAVQLVNLLLGMIFPLSDNDPKTDIDVINRTAVAVLAGYFISKNFVSGMPEIPIDDGAKTRHVFRTLTVAFIGLFSLIVLLFVRHSVSLTVSYATVSQMRDMYLASVAFLMGTSKA